MIYVWLTAAFFAVSVVYAYARKNF